MIRRILTCLVLAVALTFGASAGKPVRVACVGNSITYGFLVEDREHNSYPAKLGQMLGQDYTVGNFGHSGTTLLRKGHNPYVSQPEYQASLDFNPDVVLIHLGVNDTDPRNWPEYGDHFVEDYLALIDSYRKVNPDVRIIISKLTPLLAGHFRFESGTRDWRKEINKAIERVAEIANVELTDFGAPLLDRPNLIPENIHPNAEGAQVMANTAYGAITGDHGGLWLPPVYGNGMVLQQLRPIRIAGQANSGTPVTVTLGDDKATAVAGIDGNWHVDLPARPAARGLTMTVWTPETSITYRDVAVGEVWIASGQSNMEFELRHSTGGAEAIATSKDPDLRFFSRRGTPTDGKRWNDSIMADVNALRYFRPTKWQAVDPDNAPLLSAVAYYFARALRDSLDVPVGIIANAVGGSPTESWIDTETMWDDMPGAMRNWRTNDYLQKWVQKRSIEDAGDAPSDRHPYEPTYLYSAGMRDLGKLSVAGVIWYQGESNAHNTDLHEQLFPMLVKSWRKQFGRPTLPFLFVQLSSIDRPSWPVFRDSQRRMADRLANTAMAVSSDLGDSLDVHPHNKRPVGERLSRLALRNVYGYNLIESGPSPSGLHAEGDTLVLTMKNSQGMHPATGDKLLTFEVSATPDGVYYPAEATVGPNGTIRVYSMDVKEPRSVRYGWQPFTRANLVNSDALPASTFKVSLPTAEETADPDAGIDEGVSASFTGILPDGRVLVAGGCNFPGDPMAPGAVKRFYSGIYAAVPEEGQLVFERIGSLPEATAYGVSATTPEGVFMAGGTTADKALRTAFLMKNDGSIENLPELPYTVDNAYCAAIGDKVYIAGGNCNGLPSNNLICLDLKNPDKGWKELKPFPGEPRVQPVLAASGNKLYLFGGFAGRTAQNEPRLSTDGFVYDPKSNKWHELSGPTDDMGKPLSLGGGCAVTLADGRIACLGGVNAEIFLSALRAQPADYLSHPVEWYRFNPMLVVFNPADAQWTIATRTPDIARAGASAVVTPQDEIIVAGGELKPRIRTRRVSRLHL
ncbi:MAG: cyclically-permuted mutarotase family protein [Paramuribaculum sp.]|nr:cyclically-permuted mutarotase family protein [Paramuribaculum sp.]